MPMNRYHFTAIRFNAMELNNITDSALVLANYKWQTEVVYMHRTTSECISNWTNGWRKSVNKQGSNRDGYTSF